jgi:hypothetical protein
LIVAIATLLGGFRVGAPRFKSPPEFGRDCLCKIQHYSAICTSKSIGICSIALLVHDSLKFKLTSFTVAACGDVFLL